jgi:hypothetical protein
MAYEPLCPYPSYVENPFNLTEYSISSKDQKHFEIQKIDKLYANQVFVTDCLGGYSSGISYLVH